MADKEKMRKAFGADVEEDAAPEGGAADSDKQTKVEETRKFFEAGAAKDYAKAAEHFATMMELCGAYVE